METEFSKQYPFISAVFSHNEIDYSVSIAPVYYGEEDGLDLLVAINALLFSSTTGTSTLQIDGIESEPEWSTTIIPTDVVNIIIEKIKNWRKG